MCLLAVAGVAYSPRRSPVLRPRVARKHSVVVAGVERVCIRAKVVCRLSGRAAVAAGGSAGWGMLTGVKPDPVLADGDGAPGTTAAPHAAQNWAPAGTSAPHFEQGTAMTISCVVAMNLNSDQCRTGAFATRHPALSLEEPSKITHRAPGFAVGANIPEEILTNADFVYRLGRKKGDRPKPVPFST